MISLGYVFIIYKVSFDSTKLNLMNLSMVLLVYRLCNIETAELFLKVLWSQYSRQVKKNGSKLMRTFKGKKKRESVQCVLIYFSHGNLTAHSPLSCCLAKFAAQSWFMTSSLLFYYQPWRNTASLWTLHALKIVKNKQLTIFAQHKVPSTSYPVRVGEFLLCPLQYSYTQLQFIIPMCSVTQYYYSAQINGKPTNQMIPVCFAIK